MTKQSANVPCRLYALLAREAPVGVVFRRGPSKWVQVIKWDTATDTFTLGQWFHGRIYERRCDLSPDGTLMIYFAQKINRRTMDDNEYTYAWTAISQPPYLTALVHLHGRIVGNDLLSVASKMLSERPISQSNNPTLKRY